jgi:Uri superfamily endonuclease
VPAQAGTYILLMQLTEDCRLTIGRLGSWPLAAGHYLYVGSAFGPGGLRARLAHHARVSARPHWHVDYLRRPAALRETWFVADARRREHDWAGWLAAQSALAQPVPGFGASDCRCHSHLFHSTARPCLADYHAGLASDSAELACVAF